MTNDEQPDIERVKCDFCGQVVLAELAVDISGNGRVACEECNDRHDTIASMLAGIGTDLIDWADDVAAGYFEGELITYLEARWSDLGEAWGKIERAAT